MSSRAHESGREGVRFRINPGGRVPPPNDRKVQNCTHRAVLRLYALGNRLETLSLVNSESLRRVEPPTLRFSVALKCCVTN
jgi:hypothetical protein